MSKNHLNIWQHYSQNGCLPIENNISRLLAILFEKNQGFFYLFLQRVNRLIHEKEVEELYIEENYNVYFQRKSSKFNPVKNIIGITMTAIELNDEQLHQKSENEEYDPITDISIDIGNSTIVIEVKRTSENCIDQLKEQIIKIKEYNDEKKINSCIIDFNWKEVVELLEMYKINDKTTDYLVNDFYELLRFYYSNWFPIKKLSEISGNDEDFINQRIASVIGLYNKQNENSNNDYIELDYKLIKRVNIEYSKEEKIIYIEAWSSNNCSQYWDMRKYNPNLLFLDKNEIICGQNNANFKMQYFPQIKFSHIQGNCIYYEDLDKNNEEIRNMIKNNTYDIVGKFERSKENFKDIKKILQQLIDNKYINEKAINRFDENFTNTARTFVYVSLGYYLETSIPFEEISKIDNNESNFLELLKEFIIKLNSILMNE